MIGGATFLGIAPLVPWPVIAAPLALAAVLLVVAAWRGARGVALRALVLAVLAAALLNPSLVREDRESQPDVAVVVVDESESQSVGDRRWHTAAALAAVAEALEGQEDLEVVTVRAGGAPADGEGGTRLFAAIEGALTDIPRRLFAGAIVITDGQAHDVPDDAALDSFPGPLHVLLTGRPGERDRRLVVQKAPGYGIVGKTVTMDYRIEDHKPAGGARTMARVRLMRDGKEIKKALVRVGTDDRMSFELDHAGATVVELVVAPAEGELSTVNNRAVVTVNGVRDRLRVLLISGQPHAGERAWRNLLKSDPSVDLIHFTILRPPEKNDFTPLRELSLIAFPIQELFEVKLSGFDLVVFDRYVVRDVLPPSYLRNIDNYVRQGGALLLAVGPEFSGVRSLFQTPLGRTMPARPTGRVFEQGFVPRLTGLGRRHPVTATLPGAASRTSGWGRWFRQVDVVVKRGTVLMRGPEDKPLLVLDRVGKGRVAQLMSDHIWLWARGFEGGGPQAELLRRLAHWLMKEPDLEEERLDARVAGGRLGVTRRSLDPGAARVTVTAPSGARRTLDLKAAGNGDDGASGATMKAAESGLYRVDDGRNTVFAAAGALNPLELADLRATADILAPAARATGGGIAWIADGVPDFRRTRAGRDSAGRGWMGLRRNDAYVVAGVVRVPLLPGLLVLVLAVGGLMAAWYRESG